MSEDSLFVGTFRNTDLGEQDNCFRRLDRELELTWKCPVKYSPLASALTPDFLLAVTWDIFSSGGFLYCLDRQSGACVWSKRVKDISTAAELLVFGDTLLCFCDSGVVGYQLKNGKRVMAADYSTNVYPPKVQNDSVISCSRSSLVKFQGNDLRADWTIDGLDNPWGFGCDKDHVFVANEEGLQIYDVKDGTNVGRFNSECISYVLSDGERLYFQSAHDNEDKYIVSCFSKSTGKVVWHSEVPISIGNANYSPQVEILTDKVVLVRGHCGPAYALDRFTGAIQMLLSESDMPDNRFESENQAVLFAFQGELHIQHKRVIYSLAEFPSAPLGSQILDADRNSWLNRPSSANSPNACGPKACKS